MDIQDIKFESDSATYLESLVIDTSYLDEPIKVEDIAIGRIFESRIQSSNNIEAKQIGHLVIISNISISLHWGLYLSFARPIEAEPGSFDELRVTSNDHNEPIAPKGIVWSAR